MSVYSRALNRQMNPKVIRSLRLARSYYTRVVGGRRLAKLARTGDAPIPVFFYHRVASSSPNPWSMSNSQFEQQIDMIRTRCEVIGLDEVQRRVRLRESFRPAAAITFDDGYADNNGFALPLIVKLGLPCTYFVSVENVVSGNPFPHDIDAGQPFPPNSIADLRHWSNLGIEIGLHTRTHFDFSTADDPQTLEREIMSAKEDLEDLISRPVRYFAFPYGMPEHLSQAAIAAVAKCGMSGFCSAFGAYNQPGRDDYHIRRIHGDIEHERFVNWLFFDKHKLRREPLVNYTLEPDGDGSLCQETITC